MKLLDSSKTGYFSLPEEERIHFKQPLDILLKSDNEISSLIDFLKKDQFVPKIITVGDVSTQRLLEESLVPDLAIIDELVQRKKVSLIDFSHFKVVEAKNPAGMITFEAWNIIQESLKRDDIKIIIKIIGEEDLLVLPAICETPYNSKVLYGQPNEGLVSVTVTEEMKTKILSLIQKMVKVIEN